MMAPRFRVWRLLVAVLALLAALALVRAAQAVLVGHFARVRGLGGEFPPVVADADVPSLGVNVALEQYDPLQLAAVLDGLVEAGFVWVRQPFSWHQLEPVPGGHEWAAADRIVAAVAERPELRLVAVLDDDPPIPPADPGAFAAFAGAFAARYAAQIDHYQIWDEPNLSDHWGGGPVNPAAYADLLARSAEAIRAADRTSAGAAAQIQTAGARILVAGLAPTLEIGPQNLSDVRYLEQLYRVGAAPTFDIVTGKPYGFDTGPDDRRVGETVLNFSRLILLREVMVKYGDAAKPVWASHWGWNALPPGWAGLPSIWGQTDETTQAGRTVDALERVRAEWPWAGAMVLEHLQPAVGADDPRWGFALLDPGGAPRPVYEALERWSRALPDAAPPGGYPAATTWATYDGAWRVGPLGGDIGADGDRAAFHFDGTGVALTVRRGPYRAFLYVTVDGQPANGLPHDAVGQAYVVLNDDTVDLITVPLARGLAPGSHVVEVVAERGQGQWALVSWHVSGQPVEDGWVWKLVGLALAALACLALAVWADRGVDWSGSGRAVLGWPDWAQVALAAGMTALLWIVLACGAREDLFELSGPVAGLADGISPWFLVAIPLLLALGALFVLRLDLGLALVAFTAPFYLQPAGLFYSALSLPELLIVLCATAAAFRRRRRAGNRLTLLDAAVLVFVLAAVLASLIAADVRAALLELCSVFLLPALGYAAARIGGLDRRAAWWIVGGWAAGGAVVACIGLGQYALGYNVVLAEGGLARLRSIYPSPNNVGLYLGRLWPLLVAITLWDGDRRRRLLCGLAAVPVTLALVLSFSRGALVLGLPVALVVMAGLAGGRTRWAALALVVLGGLAIVPLMRVPRFGSLLQLQQGSSFFRVELWRSSLALIQENPWFGVGPGGFQAAFRTRYILPGAWQEPNLEHPHTIYLDHWTRLGVLGLVAGVVVQVAFWRRLWQGLRAFPDVRALLIGLAGSMAVLLAHGLVDNTVFFPDMALTFFLTLALLEIVQGQPRDQST